MGEVQEWVSAQLVDITDADPEVLAKYVLALLEGAKRGSRAKLRENFCTQLDTFLNTSGFVDSLFAHLESTGFEFAAEEPPRASRRRAGESPERAATARVPRSRSDGEEEDEEEEHRRGRRERSRRRDSPSGAAAEAQRWDPPLGRDWRGPPPAWGPPSGGHHPPPWAPPPPHGHHPPSGWHGQAPPPPPGAMRHLPSARGREERGGGGSPPRGSRARATLHVSHLPGEGPESTGVRGRLVAHFGRFGRVVHVKARDGERTAFVQLGDAATAARALAAPDAVLGSRFVRLSWAMRDTLQTEERTGAPLPGQQEAVAAAPPKPPPGVGVAERRAAAEASAQAKASQLARLAAIGKQKEELLQAQMQAQRALLAKLQSGADHPPKPAAVPAPSPALALAAQAAATRAAVSEATAAAERAAGELRRKYEAAVARSNKRTAVVAPAPAASPAAKRPRSAFTLDNRPKARGAKLPEGDAAGGESVKLEQE